MKEENIPNTFYRVSVKGLIYDETGKKFMTICEDNGWWELPGGGMDWGENPEEALRREIHEEMGLAVTEITPNPKFYLIGKNMDGDWALSLVFETKVKDFNFTKSKECQDMKFISPDEVSSINAWRTVKELSLLLKNK